MSDRGREVLALVTKREEFLTALETGAIRMRDLVDKTGNSRSTVNRAVRELQEAELVRKTDGGYALTPTGQLSLTAYRTFLRNLDSVNDAAELLAPLDDVPLDPSLLGDAEYVLAEGAAVYRPLEQIHERLATADRVRAALPVLARSKTVEQCREIASNGGDVEFVVSPALWQLLSDRFGTELEPAVEEDALRVAVGEMPPIGLFLTEGATPEMSLLVFNDHSVHGAIISESCDALEWGEQYFTELWEDADVRTSELLDA